jgi:succinyl-diaminopimelate desuccinylase
MPPAASTIDPVALTADLIRRPSVTPDAAGAIGLLAERLQALGFACHRCDRDVVPVGDEGAWTHAPFSGDEAQGALWGRGAQDMKSAVAAFAAAAAALIAEAPPKGSIALMITGDEEGPGVDGTRAILDWMASRGEQADVCLVGEPTSAARFGDVMKIGRRGSMTGYFTATGVQGHSAYPEKAKNPLPALARLLDRLASTPLDQGTAHFQPSTLAITTIDVGNPANNVIPAQGRAKVNIRFNDAHTSDSIAEWLRGHMADVAAAFGVALDLELQVSGESFLTPPGPLSNLVADAVEAVSGRRPAMTTGGGTSDARFVKNHCPVVEFGLVGDTMHQVDERVPVKQVRQLAAVYEEILRRYFA